MTAPKGLKTRGRRLWASLLAQDEALADVQSPLREVAIEACRVADLLERYDAECISADLTLDNGKGLPITNPLLVERRQQQQNLKQLVAALRLPDEATGKRPQKRTARGAQRPSGAVVIGASSKARLRSVG